MKLIKLLPSLVAGTLLMAASLPSVAQVKVGDNPTTINSSAILELEHSNRALLITRVADTAAVASPVNGMIIYDQSAQCFRGYSDSRWSNCFGHLSGALFSSIDYTNTRHYGYMSAGQVVGNGVYTRLGYSGGNGEAYNGQTIASTGVTGLTATLAAGTLQSGTGAALTFTITGTPSGAGIAYFFFNMGGQSYAFERMVSDDFSTNTLCSAATVSGYNTSGTGCASVAGATLNDIPNTIGIEYNWANAADNIANVQYGLVEINGQCWYRYNTVRTAGNTTAAWVNGSDVGWSGYYNAENINYHNKLYQWSAAMDGATQERAQGACAPGFHVPSDCEWMYLENSMGLNNLATVGWRFAKRVAGIVPNDIPTGLSTGASYGFNSLEVGWRNDQGVFQYAGYTNYYWSSSTMGPTKIYRSWNSSINEAGSDNQWYVWRGEDAGPSHAMSVRCLKD